MPKRKSKKTDKDLFEESTMTFGEHLEALRKCLFKSVIALMAGTVIGLSFGWDVVNFIQTPLHNALTKYYKEQSVEQMQKKLKNLEDEGRGTAGHRGDR